MKFDYAARVRVGIGLIVLLALYSNWQLLKDSTQFDVRSVGNDEITVYQRRFDGVRKFLPPHGAVGYVGDPVSNADGSPNGAALRNWYLAQYTLAPLVLSTGLGQSIIPGQSDVSGHRLFLMNNSAQVTDPAPPEEGGFTVQELGSGNHVLNFGNGVRLLSSESQ